MDAYEALKETFDDLFQQAVEEGCYTEDEAAEPDVEVEITEEEPAGKAGDEDKE